MLQYSGWGHFTLKKNIYICNLKQNMTTYALRITVATIDISITCAYTCDES